MVSCALKFPRSPKSLLASASPSSEVIGNFATGFKLLDELYFDFRLHLKRSVLERAKAERKCRATVMSVFMSWLDFARAGRSKSPVRAY